MNRLIPTQSWLDRQARYNERKNKKVEDEIDTMTGASITPLSLVSNEMMVDEDEIDSMTGASPGRRQHSPQEQPTNLYQPTDTSNITTKPEPVFQPEPESEPIKKKVDEVITRRALSNPDLSNHQRQAIIDRYEAQHGKFNFGALLAGFGTAMQGKGASGTDDVFTGQRQRMQDELDAFDTNREQVYQDEVRGRERETYENERDPNSNISITARDYLAQMGIPVPTNASYNQIQKMYPYAVAKINLDLKRSEIDRDVKKDAYEFQQQTLKRTTDYGNALDEEGAKTVKNLTAQTNSVLGNIRAYTDMMREGGFSRAEKQRQQQMLAAELGSLDPALMPPSAKEEWKSILNDRWYEFNSTTAKRVEQLIDYIAGNARDTIKNNLTDTAIDRFNSPQALRQLGIDKIRMIDPRDGKPKYISVEAYQNALKQGWREVK